MKALVEKGLEWPLGLAIGADGDLFVADGGFNYALRPGGTLELIGMLFSPGFPGWIRAAVSAGQGAWIVTTANGEVARWDLAAQASEVLAKGYDRLMGVAVAPGGAVIFAEMPPAAYSPSKAATLRNSPMAWTGRWASPSPPAVLSMSPRQVPAASPNSPAAKPKRSSTAWANRTASPSIRQTLHAGCTRQTAHPNRPRRRWPPGHRRQPARRRSARHHRQTTRQRRHLSGPMHTFSGLAAAAGTIYVAGDGEGSVLAVRAG